MCCGNIIYFEIIAAILCRQWNMVPTGTGNQGKPGKMGRHFPVRKKSGNFVKTGKVREFYSKYWKNWKKLHWKIEKNTGKVREICQPVIVKTLQT